MFQENRTTSDPEKSSRRNAAAVSPLAIAVPIVAPTVPNAGIGPSPRISTTFSRMFSTVMAIPSRNGVCASPAARNAALIMKKSSISDAEDEQDAGEGQRLGLHLRRRVDQLQQRRGEHVTERRQDAEGHEHRGQERLVDRPVDLLRLVRADEARHQHAHAAEDGGNEDDDENEDVDAHADGGVADVADVVADHRLIDDGLDAAEDVLQHRRPREPPDRAAERTLDDRSIKRLVVAAPWRSWENRGRRGPRSLVIGRSLLGPRPRSCGRGYPAHTRPRRTASSRIR